MSKVALITVTHDPLGKSLHLFKKVKQELEEVYSELFITISEESSLELIKEMKKSRFKVKVIPKKGAAHARREVLQFGLSGESQFFHYMDFDRLLTWSNNHLGELRDVVEEMPKHKYLIIGRTARAMKTHPTEWIETEKVTNKICSLELGKTVDITAGSCSFSRSNAELIHAYSKEKMTDAEWAMSAYRVGKCDISYMAVDGLEYHEEINGVTRDLTETEKWLGRLRLSLIISETAYSVGK
ncbi:hypothetical protein GCM10008967_32850 [Bacillus carboniphilus]|uniref:Glycosyltransferase 2-like domain-containing protein n=1 Tax=Bacillus carboniphilus TaxID=86663 RepID=A0ABP3G988_9BACI